MGKHPGIILPAFWVAVAQLQALLTWARHATPSAGESFDDAFTTILEDYDGKAIPVREVRRRFRSLSRNRAQKYRARRRLMGKKGHLFSGKADVDPALAAERNELTEMARGVVNPEEWELLRDLAEDRSFAGLAERVGLSVAALKSRVFRIRERIRVSSAGTKILRALSA